MDNSNNPKKNSSFKPFIYVLAAVFIFSLGVRSKDVALFNRSAVSINKQNAALPKDLDYSSVNEVYSQLKTKFDGTLDNQKLTDGLKKGLVEASGDKYTEYFSTEENKEFNEQIGGTFMGIGAELGKDDNGSVVIVSPIKGYPAEKVGLQPKDIIIKIDKTDALGLSISEAVKIIRGPKDTTVKLAVLRGSEQLEFTITREEIKIPSVEYSMLDGGIGYVQISRFSDDTSSLVKQAATSFALSGTLKGVIVDVRNDPGGYLEQAVKVASEWLPSGATVVIEKRGGMVQNVDKAGSGQAFLGVPTIVLTNEGSASASEILAGALRDNNVAKIVGMKTYGKGSVQQVAPLGDGSAVKVTIARWFTPADKNIDKEGIEPDEKVEITKEQLLAKQDPQKDRAVQLLTQ